MTQRRFLFATDLSDESLRVLPVVARYAHVLDARLTLLKVLVRSNSAQGRLFVSPVPFPSQDDHEADAREAMAAAIDSCELPGQVDCMVHSSIDIETGILEARESTGASLICMVTHGREGLSRLILGSVTESVLRKATTPIWIFPHDMDVVSDLKLDHFMVTTDQSAEAERAFAPVAAKARVAGAKVTLFSSPPMALLSGHNLSKEVSDAELEEFLEKTRGELRGQADSFEGVTFEVGVSVGDHIEDVVGEFASANDVDVIALSTHGRKGMVRIALGSVAEKIIRRSPVPVIAYPPPDSA